MGNHAPFPVPNPVTRVTVAFRWCTDQTFHGPARKAWARAASSCRQRGGRPTHNFEALTTAQEQALRDQLSAAVAHGNGVMAKRYMQMNGLTAGMSDPLVKFTERVLDYVRAGKLPAAAVAHMTREMLEYGAKRMYVLRGDPARMRRVKPGDLEHPVTDLDQARVARSPAGPRCNYSFVGADEVRQSFSEFHQRRGRSERFGDEFRAAVENVLRVAVISGDLETGIVTVTLDSPGTYNPHGERADAYVEHYLDAARRLLNCDLYPLDWHTAVAKLQLAEHQTVVEPTSQRVEDDQGLPFSMGNGRSNLRQYDTFHRNTPSIVLRKHGRFKWLKTAPPADAAAARAGRALLRDVVTEIQAEPAMVAFDSHTLAPETRYVLDYIRRVA